MTNSRNKKPDGSPKKLHLGCGETYLKGYVNIDFPQSEHAAAKVKADRCLDIRALDYPAGTVDEVRAHHLLEHFSRAESLALLMRWRRWLKSGGLLVLETPDFEGILNGIAAANNLREKLELERHLFGSQEAHWAIHYDGWFEEKYRLILERLGFEIIKIVRFKNNLTKLLGYKLPGLFDVVARNVPGKAAARLGVNTLPNILCVASKKEAAIDETKTASELLSYYLVGNEKANSRMLGVWMEEFKGAELNISES